MTLVREAPVTRRVAFGPARPLRAETLRGFAPAAGVAVLLTTAVLLAGSAEQWQGG